MIDGLDSGRNHISFDGKDTTKYFADEILSTFNKKGNELSETDIKYVKIWFDALRCYCNMPEDVESIFNKYLTSGLSLREFSNSYRIHSVNDKNFSFNLVSAVDDINLHGDSSEYATDNTSIGNVARNVARMLDYTGNELRNSNSVDPSAFYSWFNALACHCCVNINVSEIVQDYFNSELTLREYNFYFRATSVGQEEVHSVKKLEK